ncbi:tetratricopeptide repeat protein [Burkholderia cepacia]|uniref:Tetratricopeptide repeat family protein n=1 Tax=Burkholderia cepacia TaxID=292 RepID=A0AA88Z4Q5_BURCE|nr:tetratricopeptide repeat protein [Burkholderia cepacia]KGB98913.1 tetratricopeptide repeat family protein [Burkholderia cepacia]
MHNNDRVLRLLSYLGADPTNRSLQIDLAHAAFDAGQHDLCDKMLDELRSAQPHSAGLLNLEGLNALARNQPERALASFRAIVPTDRDPTVQYNEAYALALLERYEEALGVLVHPALHTLPCAVALCIRVLHHLQRLDDAIALGEQYAATQPEIAAPLSVALFDAGKPDDARKYALLAGGAVDAWAILGLLDLECGAVDSAEQKLNSALQYQPTHGRAMLGRGLIQMARRQFDAAADTLSIAARTLDSHAGTWIAAGWAFLYKEEFSTARRHFDEALALDRTFAEVHGSLAVLDYQEGLLDSARSRADTALHLDKNCASAMLALSLLQASDGNIDRSRATLDAALNRPVGTGNRSFLQKMSAFSQTPPDIH